MSKENEPAKLLLPYLQRADELQKHEPLVAYYCRLYAMERGLKIPQIERTKTTNSLLVSLINQLEKDKKSLKLGPDDHLHVEGFALNVFAKADKQDRAGRADLNTAKTFYAASIFFEILNQFGELQPDLEQKQKYAAWKAADIRKAIKEGRKPVPGPPGGESDISEFSTAQSDEYDIEPSEAGPAIKPAPESDSSSQLHDNVQFTANRQLHSAPIPPPPPSHFPPSPPPYSANDYPSNEDHSSHNLPQPPSASRHENSSYSQFHQHQPYPQEPQSYPQEPQSHLPNHYPSQDISSSYPNFQSYPSFTESSLPAAPSHNPSYYQGSDTSYSMLPPSANHPSNSQLSDRKGSAVDAAVPPPKTYQYDSNYQPSPEKIAEAHKAARFAVGALAFDDVSIAVDYLKKSLELLTNPSAGQ